MIGSKKSMPIYKLSVYFPSSHAFPMRLGTTLPSPYPVTQKCQCNYTFHKWNWLSLPLTTFFSLTTLLSAGTYNFMKTLPRLQKLYKPIQSHFYYCWLIFVRLQHVFLSFDMFLAKMCPWHSRMLVPKTPFWVSTKVCGLPPPDSSTHSALKTRSCWSGAEGESITEVLRGIQFLVRQGLAIREHTDHCWPRTALSLPLTVPLPVVPSH